MRRSVTRWTMAMGLLVLSGIGAGCDSEPEGSCITMSPFSTDFDTYGSHEVCQDPVTVSACSAAGGRFDEGGDCGLFDLLHIFSAN